jgi:putative transposase
MLVEDIDLFWRAVEVASTRTGMEPHARAILPEHFHLIINPANSNISTILQRIKLSFSMNYRKRHHRRGRIWQIRFWDHIIRNERDYWSHLTYIHLNPVKHGLAINPFDYPHSSIEKFRDYYSDLEKVEFDNASGDFGE